MLAEELLAHSDLQLPVTRPGGDFLTFAHTLLETFRLHVQGLAGLDLLTQTALAALPDIIATSHGVYRVLQEYLRGHPHGAYAELDATILPIRHHIDRLQSGIIGANQIKHMYRVRHQVAPPLTREEMFHVPFELRHKVAPQRYSIPGLPSLYLGGSLYTCWVEMRQPVFADLQASCLWLRPGEQLSYIDFSHRPRWLCTWLSNNGGAPLPQDAIDYIVSHIICWPLMAVASVRTKYPADPFKPEYILPQVLLQWVSQQPDLDGVRYFSTHVDCVSDNPHWTANYVFPARVMAAQGRCTRLRTLFKMTEPMNWQLLSTLNLNGIMGTSFDRFDFEFIRGIREPYGNTAFGLVQSRLNELANRIKLFNQQPGGNPALGNLLP